MHLQSGTMIVLKWDTKLKILTAQYGPRNGDKCKNKM